MGRCAFAQWKLRGDLSLFIEANSNGTVRDMRRENNQYVHEWIRVLSGLSHGYHLSAVRKNSFLFVITQWEWVRAKNRQ